MSMPRLIFCVAVAAALAACAARQAPETATRDETLVAPAGNVAAPDVAPTPEPAATVVAPKADQPHAVAATAIPEALRGRWGLVPADCTSTRGDAKGLLQISENALRFYESRGALTKVEESDATRLVGAFDFSGEGQSWRRRMALDGQDDGKTLVRREYGADAMPGPLRYRKCDA